MTAAIEGTPMPGIDDGPEVLNPKHWPTPKGYANGMMAEGRVLVTGGIVGWDETETFPEGFVARRDRPSRTFAPSSPRQGRAAASRAADLVCRRYRRVSRTPPRPGPRLSRGLRRPLSCHGLGSSRTSRGEEGPSRNRGDCHRPKPWKSSNALRQINSVARMPTGPTTFGKGGKSAFLDLVLHCSSALNSTWNQVHQQVFYAALQNREVRRSVVERVRRRRRDVRARAGFALARGLQRPQGAVRRWRAEGVTRCAIISWRIRRASRPARAGSVSSR